MMAWAVSWNYIGLVAGCAFLATVLPLPHQCGLGRTSPQASSMISAISPALIILGVGFYPWSDARAAKAPAAES
jgi:hypothetical protein